MDPTRFDSLIRSLGASRRAVVTALLVNLVAPVAADRDAAAKRGRGKNGGKSKERSKTKGRGKERGRRVRGEQLPARCCSTNPCTPGPGKNLGKCCLEDANLAGQNFKGANLGGANLSGAILTNANFSGANLGKACLVDANLTGAVINGSTNTFQAVFCRTTMPDGSTNNSGCNRGSVCCPTCDADNLCPGDQVCCDGRCEDGECCASDQCPSGVCCDGACCAQGQVCDTTGNPDVCCTPATCQSQGVECGPAENGCGQSLSCGGCPIGDTPSCNEGTCATCAATCPESCFVCLNLADGSTICSDPGTGECEEPCSSNAECTAPERPACVLSVTLRSTGQTDPVAPLCDLPEGTGVCTGVTPCS